MHMLWKAGYGNYNSVRRWRLGFGLRPVVQFQECLGFPDQ